MQKYIIILLAMVSALALGLQAQSGPAVSTPDNDKLSLTWSETSFDFGEIQNKKAVSHTFTLTNTGSEPLLISKVKPACGCTVPTYTKEEILPGETGEVTLTYNPSKPGVVSKSATVFINAQEEIKVLKFTAMVK